MRIVSVLAAGIAEAKNGTAVLYKRGTSSAAQWFRDFEGNDPATLGDVVQLDAWGAATIYVNEMAQVIAYDVNGQSVRDWVDANAAPTTEVRSLAFTGVDYDTGEAAPGKPTTLQAVLDKWLSVNGAPDWKILVNGSPVSITSAVASLAGVYCNVKNPAYAGGAVGDGVTDDIDAIVAAIADCESMGGGTVFFPAGEYRISLGLTVPNEVNLQGSGSVASSIKLDNAANAVVLLFPGDVGVDRFQELRGLRIFSAQANTADLVKWTNAKLRIIDCEVGDGVNSTGSIVGTDTEGATTGYRLQLIRSTLRLANGFSCLKTRVTTEAKILSSIVHQCRFVGGTANFQVICEALKGVVSECEFDLNSSGGLGVDMRFGGVVVGNIYDVLGGGGSSKFILPPVIGGAYKVVEASNNLSVGAILLATSTGPPDSGSDTVEGGTLNQRYLETIDNTAQWVASSYNYGVEYLHRTVAGAQSIVLLKGIEGQRYTLILHNDGTGGNITFTWNVANGTFVTRAATEVVGDNQVKTIHFVCSQIGTKTRAMVQVGDTVAMNE